ncbi:hypothetical protein GGR53DRAFT_467990 [Hypoxylon sp. FL1150]|nr:hypothetical protein GGR53DRAFT_467990 [Hypoxylon sp. FL1150]
MDVFKNGWADLATLASGNLRWLASGPTLVLGFDSFDVNVIQQDFQGDGAYVNNGLSIGWW